MGPCPRSLRYVPQGLLTNANLNLHELLRMSQTGEYDLAGFAVGAVKKDKLIDGKSIKAGDVVLALKSSGVHSNGFSLVRKVLPKS